jgi:hypothetical protein
MVSLLIKDHIQVLNQVLKAGNDFLIGTRQGVHIAHPGDLFFTLIGVQLTVHAQHSIAVLKAILAKGNLALEHPQFEVLSTGKMYFVKIH